MAYKIITAVGEETPKNNPAFDQVERFVNEHIKDGWRPLGGVSISSVVGPKAFATDKDDWWLRVAQALIRETEE